MNLNTMFYNYNNDNINFDEWLEELKTTIRCKTNGEYQLATIEYKGEDKNGYSFGFSNGYPAFCHANKLVGTDPSGFKAICNGNTLCVIHSYDNSKNNRCRYTTWFCPIDIADEKTCDIVSRYGELAIQTCQERMVERETLKKQFEQSQEDCAAKINRILNGEHYKIIRKKEESSYGGHKLYTYEFSNQISKKIFIAFLEALGLPTQAKPCVVPICPETVEIRSYDNVIWHYEWHGEWDD